MIAQRQKSAAREEILTSIRKHLAESAPHDAVREEQVRGHGSSLSESVGPAHVPFDQPPTLLGEFCRAGEAVGANCLVVEDVREAAGAIDLILEKHTTKRVAVSDSAIVHALLPYISAHVEWVKNASGVELFSCTTGITGTQLGIAETGTLVLASASERHRLITLIPPCHIAILEASRISRNLREVLALVKGEGPAQLSRSVTFVTGPSRTSDIELTLAIGVHGPQELHVIIINPRTAPRTLSSPILSGA